MKHIFLKLLVNVFFLMTIPLCAMDPVLNFYINQQKKINEDKKEYYKGLSEQDKQRVVAGFDDYLKGSSDKASYRRAFHYVALAKQEKYKINGQFLSFVSNDGYCKDFFIGTAS